MHKQEVINEGVKCKPEPVHVSQAHLCLHKNQLNEKINCTTTQGTSRLRSFTSACESAFRSRSRCLVRVQFPRLYFASVLVYSKYPYLVHVG